MEISGKNPLIRLEHYTRHARQTAHLNGEGEVRARRQNTSAISADRDDVLLSPLAREILDVRKKLPEMPEMRTDRIAELKQRIAAGRFVIDPDRIAGRMIAEGLITDLYV